MFNFSPKDVECSTDRAKLIASMKTTAVNRYNASTRLEWQSKITFTVSTLFSLGLIFIPLMQLAKVPLKLNGDVLGAIQIFLAVTILVYSIVIGTAKFELRSVQLNECGDRIKKLIRDLRVAPNGTLDEEKALLKRFSDKYAAVITGVENHERTDYILTILRSSDLFVLTWPGRIFHFIIYCLLAPIPHLASIILILIKAFLITDMFGATNIFAKFLHISC